VRSKPFVVGLRGLAGCGKTTVADRVCTRVSLRRAHFPSSSPAFQRWPIAGPLKQGLAQMGITKDRTPDLYRLAAQCIGTDIVRAADPDHWVNLFRYQTALPSLSESVLVVDDVRFPNEAGVCDLVLFIEPDFAPADLGDRAGHESERWNLNREGRIDALVRNPEGNPDHAADVILGLVASHL
jgi:hypothetical protein